MASNSPLDVRKLADVVLVAMASSTGANLALLRALAPGVIASGPIDRIALIIKEGDGLRVLGPVDADGSEGPSSGKWLEDDEGQIDLGALPVRPVSVVPTSEDPLGRALAASTLERCTLVPLLDGHGVLGALALAHTSDSFGPEQVQASIAALATIGAHMGTTLSLQRIATGESSDTKTPRTSETSFFEDGGAWEAAALRSIAMTGRLASLGTLAGGVIHEVNNPAAFIALAGGQIEKFVTKAQQQDGCQGLEPVVDLAQGIRESVDQIQDMVAAFRLLIGVTNRSVVVTVDLERVLKAAVELTRAAHRHDAGMETDFQPMPPCPGHYVEIGPIVVHVLVNAIESLRTTSSPKMVRVEGRVHDDEIQVRIQDTGEGIPAPLLPRVFEPFFTTRDTSRHAGLGLTIARETVRTMGGRMDIESEVGRGTTVHINVPVRQSKEEAS